MGGLQATFLRRMLHVSDELIESRRHAVTRYRAGIAASLGDRVVVHGPPAGVRENGYLLVLTSKLAAGRDLSARLHDRGIGSANTYPETLDAQPPAATALRYGDLAIGREFCRTTFNLPLFAGITDHEVDESIEALVEVFDALG
jgi:dTDP-4-amino-4,6-dideoxygalactose transaminase